MRLHFLYLSSGLTVGTGGAVVT